MDDRLSERYRRMLKNKSGSPVGGTFTAGLPRALRRAAAILPRSLLRVEKLLMDRIERRSIALFDQILMVSPQEAGELNAKYGSDKAVGFPPLIAPRPLQPVDFSNGLRFVAVGNANYGPNLEALTFLDRIAARVRSEAGPASAPFSFQAAGRQSPELSLEHVEHLGFVPDLGRFLAGNAVMIAPILNGTGIKTKVIDALEYGVPVVSTELGVEGLGLTPGRHYLHAADEEEFVQALLRLVQSDTARRGLALMARDARDIALTTHNRRLLAGRIRGALGNPPADPIAKVPAGACLAGALALMMMGQGIPEYFSFPCPQSMPPSAQTLERGIAQ